MDRLDILAVIQELCLLASHTARDRTSLESHMFPLSPVSPDASTTQSSPQYSYFDNIHQGQWTTPDYLQTNVRDYNFKQTLRRSQLIVASPMSQRCPNINFQVNYQVRETTFLLP
jgi:hypothetical protein